MDKESRLKQLGDLMDATKMANGAASAYLKGKVRALEARYEMSSKEMLEALDTGRQKETADIAQWLFYLDALRAHEG